VDAVLGACGGARGVRLLAVREHRVERDDDDVLGVASDRLAREPVEFRIREVVAVDRVAGAVAPVLHRADRGLGDLTDGDGRRRPAEDRDGTGAARAVDDELPQRPALTHDAEDVREAQHHDVHRPVALEDRHLLLREAGARVALLLAVPEVGEPVGELGGVGPEEHEAADAGLAGDAGEALRLQDVGLVEEPA